MNPTLLLLITTLLLYDPSFSPQAQQQQQFECFAVDFDGDNDNSRTNSNPDFNGCPSAGPQGTKGLAGPLGTPLDSND